MRRLRYTLLTDGSSDRALMHPINWLLEFLRIDQVHGAWADLRLGAKRTTALPDRIASAIKLYPCDVLFIHRDAEGMPLNTRRDEIGLAVASVALTPNLPHICVVPVRMLEAWLLHDEAAIRQAAGNPCGKGPLNLPSAGTLESEHDPKATLHKALLSATAATGRRLKQKKRDLGQMRYRVAELIDDYGPLRELMAFKALEQDIRQCFASLER